MLLFQDDFRDGLRCDGPDAPWQVRPAAGRPQGDGVASGSEYGLVVAPPGRDPKTGRPQFAAGDTAVPVRWAALANRTCATGFPGFAAEPGTRLLLEAEVSVRVFGPASPNAGTGLDFAAAALITTDRESGIVFDFMLTDRRVYAVYERLGPPAGPAPTFSYAVPVADREPEQFHRCAVAYDRSAGVVEWYLDSSRVLTVDRIGERLADARPARDNGRPAQLERPRQLTVGLGMFAERALGQGVRLAVRGVAVRRGPS